MIILSVMAGAILFALARGGKFMNLGLLRFRLPGLILLGFSIQIIVFQKFWQENTEARALTPVAYLVSLSLLLIALALNRRVPGMKILFLGFLLNFIAIVFNGGYMPVSISARAVAGQPSLLPGQIANNVIGAGPDTSLAFFGDIFAIPKGIPFPNVFSVGDLFIAMGGAYLIFKAMTAPPQP